VLKVADVVDDELARVHVLEGESAPWPQAQFMKNAADQSVMMSPE
jgi:hypothetical protein